MSDRTELDIILMKKETYPSSETVGMGWINGFQLWRQNQSRALKCNARIELVPFKEFVLVVCMNEGLFDSSYTMSWNCIQDMADSIRPSAVIKRSGLKGKKRNRFKNAYEKVLKRYTPFRTDCVGTSQMLVEWAPESLNAKFEVIGLLVEHGFKDAYRLGDAIRIEPYLHARNRVDDVVVDILRETTFIHDEDLDQKFITGFEKTYIPPINRATCDKVTGDRGWMRAWNLFWNDLWEEALMMEEHLALDLNQAIWDEYHRQRDLDSQCAV